MRNLRSSLSVINFEKFGETKGKVFTADNFAKDWESIYVIPGELYDGVVNADTYHKVDRKALVLDMKNPRMAYVMADENNPVYIPAARFDKSADGKYVRKGFLVFSLDFNQMLPESVFFLCKQGFWEKLLKTRDYSLYFEADEFPNGDIVYYTMEECFLCDVSVSNGASIECEIPSLNQQREKISEFRTEEKYLDDIIAKKERNMLRNTTSDLVHMLGTPYSHINSALELLSYSKDDKVKGHAEYIRSNFEYMMRLIKSNSLDFKIMSQDKIPVVDFLEKYVKDWSQYGSNTFKLEFINEGIGSSTCILGNKDALTIMLDNLLDNANRHGFFKTKSEKNFVKIRIEMIDGKLNLSVANNGKLMPEDFTIDDYAASGVFATSTGRSGIGGAQVCRIVNSMNGTIDFISEKVSYPDREEPLVTFMILIPVVK